MPHYRFVRYIASFLVVIVSAGCRGADSDVPKLNPVHGKITLDGQALSNARVSFAPDKGSSSGAITDAEGKYELHHRSGELGAVAAAHAVELSTDLEGTRTPAAEKVPLKYNAQT